MYRVPKMSAGYAYSNHTTLENVMIAPDEAKSAKFSRFLTVENQPMAEYRIGRKHYYQSTCPRDSDGYGFEESDVLPSGSWDGRIDCSIEQLISNPTPYRNAACYGRKLNSGRSILFNGRLHRIYVACFSNNGTAYICSKGREIIVDT